MRFPDDSFIVSKKLLQILTQVVEPVHEPEHGLE
jgi:hypothetical protein